MLVALISFAVVAMILWQSGVLADMSGWLMTRFLPWVIFPVLFFLGLFWLTDQLSEKGNYIVAVALSVMALLGGIMQVLVAFYQRHMVTIDFSTAHDRYTNWSIVPRVMIFGVLYIVLGGLGLYNPKPLHQIFMDHQSGQSWVAIVKRARGHEPVQDPVPVRGFVRRTTR